MSDVPETTAVPTATEPTTSGGRTRRCSSSPSDAPTDERRVAEQIVAQWARSAPSARASRPSDRPVELQPRPGAVGPRPRRGLVVAPPGHRRRRARGRLDDRLLRGDDAADRISLLIAALVVPVVNPLGRVGLPRGAANRGRDAPGIGVVALMVTFATQQVVQGANDLSNQVVDGWTRSSSGCATGRSHATDKQINDAIQEMQNLVTHQQRRGGPQAHRGEHHRRSHRGGVLHRLVRDLLLPLRRPADLGLGGAALPAAGPPARRLRPGGLAEPDPVRPGDRTGRVDRRVGIMLVAGILNVPFVLAIGVLVFLGSFVPMVGATVPGAWPCSSRWWLRDRSWRSSCWPG